MRLSDISHEISNDKMYTAYCFVKANQSVMNTNNQNIAFLQNFAVLDT